MNAPHVLLAVAPYYRHIAEGLERGALAALEAAGATWEKIEAPGAFEIPAAILFASRRAGKKFDGYLALGCVIRGETTHYDHICEESARALQDLALRHGLAIGYGILTVENEAQALVRASPEKKDKGGEAARACLAMIALKRHFGGA